MPSNRFKRLLLRAVLRDVYPMVIRLVAIPDTLYLTDFDDIFHAVLGWDCGIGYAFQIQGQAGAVQSERSQPAVDPQHPTTRLRLARVELLILWDPGGLRTYETR